jgi:hypothetical protein
VAAASRWRKPKICLGSSALGMTLGRIVVLIDQDGVAAAGVRVIQLAQRIYPQMILRFPSKGNPIYDCDRCGPSALHDSCPGACAAGRQGIRIY